MSLGYMRVSKADGSQTTDLQRDALLAAGVGPDCFYEDYASGKRDSRPGLNVCLKALRDGDTLAIWKLDCSSIERQGRLCPPPLLGTFAQTRGWREDPKEDLHVSTQ